jgi:hypothetical protein
MSIINEKSLKKLVASVQKAVIKENQRLGAIKDSQSGISYYTVASIKDKPSTIGIIVDNKLSVHSLANLEQVNIPTNLVWLHATTYKEFASFISKRGVPAYICFGNNVTIDTKNKKDIIDCVKLLVDECKKLNGKDLPIVECICSLITKRNTIETLLFDMH